MGCGVWGGHESQGHSPPFPFLTRPKARPGAGSDLSQPHYRGPGPPSLQRSQGSPTVGYHPAIATVGVRAPRGPGADGAPARGRARGSPSWPGVMAAGAGVPGRAGVAAAAAATPRAEGSGAGEKIAIRKRGGSWRAPDPSRDPARPTQLCPAQF